VANLYLIDRPFGRTGLELAKADPDASVVFIQDGVYLGLRPSSPVGTRVYAIIDDVTKRGLGGRLFDNIELIGYGKLVDLIVENKVINFA
jgi:sulfur relay protein TusB/DsrH